MLDTWKYQHKFWGFLSGTVLIIVAALRDLSLLKRSPVAFGYDGYFYVVQTEHLIQNGNFYYLTKTPLILYFLAGVSYLTENNIWGIKIGAVLLHVVLSVGIFVLVFEVTQSGWYAALGCFIVSMFGLHFFMLVEYINLLGGITFLVWSCFFLLHGTKTRKINYLIIGVGNLIVSLFCHRSIFFILLLFVLLILIELSVLLFNFSHLIHRVLTIFLVWTLTAIIYLWFYPLPEVFQRFKNVFSVLPVNFVAETLLLLISTLIMFKLLHRNLGTPIGKTDQFFLKALTLSAFAVALNPFLIGENNWLLIAGRAKGLMYVQSALIVPFAFWMVLSHYKILRAYLCAILLPLITVSLFTPLPAGAQDKFINKREKLLVNLSSQRDRLQDLPIVIAPHGDQFLVTYILGVASQQRRPQLKESSEVYWLLRNVERPYPNSEIVFVEDDTSKLGTVIIVESALHSYLQTISDLEKKQLFLLNSHLANLNRAISQ